VAASRYCADGGRLALHGPRALQGDIAKNRQHIAHNFEYIFGQLYHYLFWL